MLKTNVNKENLKKVIDAMCWRLFKDVGFNMSVWHCPTNDADEKDYSGEECGTIACIGGWTDLVREEEAEPWDTILMCESETGEYLGLTREERNYLFYGELPDNQFLSDIDYCTMKNAITMLRHLYDTGELDWSKAGIVK